ncbi:MAG TPA: bifunctional [glutamine synthetase] adenylyltransferase/[glutamine synthetase]-adenylyl-L-tyrosine phosphorylase [Xanthobacteraceae bacterium]|nr:bifunctional [glutamine synthetase] adenylyltransferase/[glutamine synthetase]-adenylyl-L-tyrosine phosphorylase [Xanthobacteraceae bacterium]
MTRGHDLPPRALARRLTRAPLLSDPVTSLARVADWLATPEGAVVAPLVATVPAARALIDGIADGSPYLWDLAARGGERLLHLLQSDPDTHLAALLAGTADAMARAESDGEAMRLLRHMKAEAALLIALADIGGVWDVMRVVRALTDVADTAVATAVDYLLAGAARAGRLAPPDRKRPAAGSGYVALAMGKMGAHELNYSSDIDLIVFYDPAAPALPADSEPGPLYIRLTRDLIRLLQQRTPDGYVFRVDVRLRPDPASTQIAISVPAALDYYERAGQNWERAAMIKARPCAGDIAVGDAVLKALAPFVWRKHLDYAAVADVHAMKSQIHAFRGHGEIAVEGHNIKLGRGGIREIEFFAQTQQLIAGGRNPALRGRETLATLRALAERGFIDEAARAELEAAYRFLREVEHRLQMVADEQTHRLPADRAGVDRFARFLGFPDRDAFAAALVAQLTVVQRHYAALFENAPAQAAARRGLAFSADVDGRETLDKLARMGFRRPVEAAASVRRWLSGAPRALRGEVARGLMADLVPLVIDQFARSDNPDAAVVAFDRFLASLHGGVRLLSLLRENPTLVSVVALLLGTAPRLADTLAQQPQVIDAVLDPAFFGTLPDAKQLAVRLNESLGESASYEDFLDRVRLFGQEHMFLIGTRILSGTVSARQAGEAFAGLADVIIRAMHGAVASEFAALYGRLRGQASAVVALGKLGGREMTASSDLDLILVYDFDAENPESDGERRLHGGQYFARLTQRLVNAMSAQTNYGKLYDIDMRLRPSGRSGPVATSFASFESYQRDEAWTWEHMALTRARVVSGPPELAARLAAAIRAVLCTPRNAELIAGDVREMRQAIALEFPEDSRWNLKYAAGGLIDLEFIAQYLQLVHAAALPGILDTSTAAVLDKAARLGVLSVEDAEVLRPATRLYHDLTQILRLCLPGPLDPKTAGAGLLRLLAGAADVPDFATLEAHVAETQARVRKCFDRIVGTASEAGARRD